MINLNKAYIHLNNYPCGKTQDIVIKVGRKFYYMDILKNKTDTCIEIYNYCGDRQSFSKYGSKADMHYVWVESDGVIDRDMIEHIAEIEAAQQLLNKYRYPQGVR